MALTTESRHRAWIGLLALLCGAAGSCGGATVAHIPTSSIAGDAAFREQLAALESFGTDHIGHDAVGPFGATEDIAVARTLVELASPEQRRQLLTCDNPQVRASVGRQIADLDPDDPLLQLVRDDGAELTTPGLDDTGPNPDYETTVGAVVREAIDRARARPPAAPFIAPEERCASNDDCVVSDFPGCCACCGCASPFAIRGDHLEDQRARCSETDCTSIQEELGCAAEECLGCPLSTETHTAVCHEGRCELR